MSLQRYINGYSPAAATTLNVQVINVTMGTGGAATPYDETRIYEPSSMVSGIPLSFPVAPGTRPRVYLNGLRMLTNPLDEEAGGDVSYRTTVEGVSSVTFSGDTYAPAAGDLVHIEYWTPSLT